MKKLQFVAILLLLPLLSVYGKPVSKAQAEKIAAEFMGKRRSVSAPLACMPQRARLMAPGQSAVDTPPYYIFNAGNGDGFIIVSGDDAAAPVLGYSDKGAIDVDNLPDNMAAWLRLNALYVERCADGTIADGAQAAPRQGGDVVVEPLLGDINWGQEYPFNEMCPEYYSSGGYTHYYSGCVVAAATQIMRYWCWPKQGTGSKSYKFNGQTLSADFGSTVYDWDNMLAEYPDKGATPEQVEAAATLTYHFDVAVEMEFNEAGSGALSMLVPYAYREYFGYDDGTTMRKRNYYSSTEWLDIIRHELDEGRPVYYGATSDNGLGGHAFVCDGYDSEGYVHINWGWYGMSNGFFLVNHLTPSDLGAGGGSGGYNRDQEIITGIQPPTGEPAVFERPLYGMEFSCFDYGDDFTLMDNITNYDVLPFDGQISVVVTRDGEVLKVLADVSDSQLEGYGSGNRYTVMAYQREITTSVGSDVADGDCEVRLAFRETPSSPWQFMRHENGNPSYVRATAKDGKLTLHEDEVPHPDVTLLNELEADGDIYAGGSALFTVQLRNDAKDFDLSNIVVRFTSVDNPEKYWEYENEVNVYNGSTETVDLLVDLDADMPEGEYTISLYQEEFEAYPFKQMGGEDARLTVLPEATQPVMRLTQPVEWSSSKDIQSEIKYNEDVVQGDIFNLAVSTRNYGAAGKVGIIGWLEDTKNPEKTYLLAQTDVNVDNGETVVTALFRSKLPVDPGVYKIKLVYLTEDGTETSDPNNDKYVRMLTVRENTTNLLLKAVSLDMPDEMEVGEKYKCSLTLYAPTDFSGMVYVRMRKFTIKDGGIVYMGTQRISAGETKTIEFNCTADYAPARYVALIEAKVGGVEGTIGDYYNCYKLITISDASGIGSVETANGDSGISYNGGTLTVSAGGAAVYGVDVYGIDGTLVRSIDCDGLQDVACPCQLGRGVYVVKVRTANGLITSKLAVK